MTAAYLPAGKQFFRRFSLESYAGFYSVAARGCPFFGDGRASVEQDDGEVLSFWRLGSRSSRRLLVIAIVDAGSGRGFCLTHLVDYTNINRAEETHTPDQFVQPPRRHRGGNR